MQRDTTTCADKQGTTSDVYFKADRVIKKMIFIELYWLREYVALHHLSQGEHPAIIKFKPVGGVSLRFLTAGTFLAKHDRLAYNRLARAAKYDALNSYVSCLSLEKHPNTLNCVLITNDLDYMQIMIDVLSGLAYCHEQGVIHRDIKPTNILLTDERRAIICDFGHSLQLHSNKIANTALLGNASSMLLPVPEVCTMSHRAPEVYAYQDTIRKHKVAIEKGIPIEDISPYGSGCDVWAAGMVFLDMLLGEQAYSRVPNWNVATSYSEFWRNPAAVSCFEDLYYEHAPPQTASTQLRLSDYTVRYVRKLKHASMYFSWIKRMLDPNPATRVNASDIMKEVAQYATQQGMDINIPRSKPNTNVIPHCFAGVIEAQGWTGERFREAGYEPLRETLHAISMRVAQNMSMHYFEKLGNYILDCLLAHGYNKGRPWLDEQVYAVYIYCAVLYNDTLLYIEDLAPKFNLNETTLYHAVMDITMLLTSRFASHS